VEFEPVEFIAKLAALVPPPRAQHTPSGRGKRLPADVASTGANSDHRSPDKKRRSMTWAQRLKRVFNIDVRARAATVAARCGSGHEPAGKRSACCRESAEVATDG